MASSTAAAEPIRFEEEEERCQKNTRRTPTAWKRIPVTEERLLLLRLNARGLRKSARYAGQQNKTTSLAKKASKLTNPFCYFCAFLGQLSPSPGKKKFALKNRTRFDEPVGLGFVTTTGIGPVCVTRYAGTVTLILVPVFAVG